MNNCDVLVLGAGIIGLSTAYQIARRSKLKVCIVEKGAALGEGSTGASSAILRHRYSIDNMVFLARDGINCYREWQSFTGITKPRMQFMPHGVLWMPGEELAWSESEHRRLNGLGITSVVLDDQNLRERFPAINPCIHTPDTLTGSEHTCETGGSHLLEPDGGFSDPVAAMEDLLEACQREAVDIRMNTHVSAINVLSGIVSGVTLSDGSSMEAGIVVNALGPWCGPLNASAGLKPTAELTPTRIQVLYLDLPSEPGSILPMPLPACADLGGVYFRTQNNNQQLVVGSTLESDEFEIVHDPDNFDRFPDEDFKMRALHLLHHRLPDLPYRGSVRGYCGLYTINRSDVHPIVGETEVKNLYIANGFSGHGFKLAPAIGSLLAQTITGNRTDLDTDVPIEFLSANREPLIITGQKSALA